MATTDNNKDDPRTTTVLTNDDLSLERDEMARMGYKLYPVLLGRGQYAKVYLAEPELATVESNYKLRILLEPGEAIPKVAVKIIDTQSCCEPYVTKFLPREVAAMSVNFEHPNVIKLVDFWASGTRIYIVMEHAQHGDMLAHINHKWAHKQARGKRGFTEDEARSMFRPLLAALRHVHHNDFAHRDLKFENILLCKDMTPKLGDFGFAVEDGDEEPLRNTHCGSFSYAAPEILKKKRYDGKKADVWSLGVVLFSLIHARHPFKGKNARTTLESMKETLFLKATVTPEYKQLIRGLLRKHPEDRLTIDQIIKEPWVLNKKLETEISHKSPEMTSYEEKWADEGNEFENFKLPPVRPHRPNKLDKRERVAELIMNQRRPIDDDDDDEEDDDVTGLNHSPSTSSDEDDDDVANDVMLMNFDDVTVPPNPSPYTALTSSSASHVVSQSGQAKHREDKPEEAEQKKIEKNSNSAEVSKLQPDLKRPMFYDWFPTKNTNLSNKREAIKDHQKLNEKLNLDAAEVLQQPSKDNNNNRSPASSLSKSRDFTIRFYSRKSGRFETRTSCELTGSLLPPLTPQPGQDHHQEEGGEKVASVAPTTVASCPQPTSPAVLDTADDDKKLAASFQGFRPNKLKTIAPFHRRKQQRNVTNTIRRSNATCDVMAAGDGSKEPKRKNIQPLVGAGALARSRMNRERSGANTVVVPEKLPARLSKIWRI